MKKQDDIYVLMSLRKEYFDEMLVGLKKHEYRTRYQKVPTKAFIYISKTEKKIKAIINFGTPIISNREAISEIAEKEKAGSYKAMMEYLINGIGYALPIKSITEIEEISLEELKIKFTDFVVPQSYCL